MLGEVEGYQVMWLPVGTVGEGGFIDFEDASFEIELESLFPAWNMSFVDSHPDCLSRRGARWVSICRSSSVTLGVVLVEPS